MDNLSAAIVGVVATVSSFFGDVLPAGEMVWGEMRKVEGRGLMAASSGVYVHPSNKDIHGQITNLIGEMRGSMTEVCIPIYNKAKANYKGIRDKYKSLSNNDPKYASAQRAFYTKKLQALHNTLKCHYHKQWVYEEIILHEKFENESENNRARCMETLSVYKQTESARKGRNSLSNHRIIYKAFKNNKLSKSKEEFQLCVNGFSKSTKKSDPKPKTNPECSKIPGLIDKNKLSFLLQAQKKCETIKKMKRGDCAVCSNINSLVNTAQEKVAALKNKKVGANQACNDRNGPRCSSGYVCVPTSRSQITSGSDKGICKKPQKEGFCFVPAHCASGSCVSNKCASKAKGGTGGSSAACPDNLYARGKAFNMHKKSCNCAAKPGWKLSTDHPTYAKACVPTSTSSATDLNNRFKAPSKEAKKGINQKCRFGECGKDLFCDSRSRPQKCVKKKNIDKQCNGSEECLSGKCDHKHSLTGVNLDGPKVCLKSTPKKAASEKKSDRKKCKPDGSPTPKYVEDVGETKASKYCTDQKKTKCKGSDYQCKAQLKSTAKKYDKKSICGYSASKINADKEGKTYDKDKIKSVTKLEYWSMGKFNLWKKENCGKGKGKSSKSSSKPCETELGSEGVCTAKKSCGTPVATENDPSYDCSTGFICCEKSSSDDGDDSMDTESTGASSEEIAAAQAAAEEACAGEKADSDECKAAEKKVADLKGSTGTGKKKSGGSSEFMKKVGDPPNVFDVKTSKCDAAEEEAAANEPEQTDTAPTTSDTPSAPEAASEGTQTESAPDPVPTPTTEPATTESTVDNVIAA